MLDTNMLAYIGRRRSPESDRRLRSLQPTVAVVTSAISAGEVRFGLEGRSADLRRSMETLLAGVTILPWRDEEAAAYGVVRAQQKSSGRVLSPLDTLIAAHALTVGATLVTHDKAFRSVTGLLVEDWATDLS